MKSKGWLIIISLLISLYAGRACALGIACQLEPDSFSSQDKGVLLFLTDKGTTEVKSGFLWHGISPYLSRKYIGADADYLPSGNLYAFFADATYDHRVLKVFNTFSRFKFGRAAYDGPMFSEWQYFWSFTFGLRYRYPLRYGEIGLDIPLELGNSYYARNLLDAYLSAFSALFINLPITVYYSINF